MLSVLAPGAAHRPVATAILDYRSAAVASRFPMIDSMGTEARQARKLLFHSYHFPPIGGSGAQRPLKMVRNLTSLGYESVVVTRSGDERADRWAPEDATLVAEIPAELEIRRVLDADEPKPTARWRPLAERWLRLPDRWTAWWGEASYRVGLEAGADADLIYVWMQPYASASPGAALSRTLGKPWVADLGDPWALDEMMVYPSALHRRLDLRRMGKLLGTASAVVMSTQEAVSRLQFEFPEFAERPVVAIPNGFDPDDFEGTPQPRSDGKFRIVHTGYLHTELGEQHRDRRRLRGLLGGSVAGLDILTRSHVYLVEAINRLLTTQPQLRDALELHLAGVLSETDNAVALRCPVATVHGYMSHADSIDLMRTADLLFLPMQNLPQGVRATIVPGKTYEYLASGTPILAAVPEGDARDILGEAGNATIVRPDDVDGLSAGILTAVDRFRSGDPADRPRPDVVSRFEYPRLAAELAEIFDTVLGAPRLAGSRLPTRAESTR
jgi:glycosyltransferase involved in cell wall biosynthesis